MYDYGLIGNCQVSALIDRFGAMRWLCLPRPDSPPVFGSLLDPDGGVFQIRPSGSAKSRQEYRKNTNILTTEFQCDDGTTFSLTDFCPRFLQQGGMYRPPGVVRIVRALAGSPQIQVICKPVLGWEKVLASPMHASGHLRYVFPEGTLHVMTNMPVTYLLDGSPFLLQQPLYFAVLWDLHIGDDLEKVALEYMEKTETYWRRWVKHCAIPTLFQEEVIRSALALKLHCFEDTGAILAAVTTSLPEKIGGERNWDYRFCWLRDAFFTLGAFHSLSHFEEMEGFLRFLLNLVNYQDLLAPVYGLDQKVPLPEKTAAGWRGFQDSLPVRFNNAAASQVQNDVYGELILAFAPIYLDERFHHLRSERLDKTLMWLAERCAASIGRPDAGIWEIRNGQQEHSFTNLMCWAGLDRVIGILKRGTMRVSDPSVPSSLETHRARAASRLAAAVVDGTLRNGPSDPSLDASALLLPIVRFPDETLCIETVRKIAAELSCVARAGQDHLLYRYIRPDDFGAPDEPFLICSFWLAQAFARQREFERGRQILRNLMPAANPLGLFSEHFSPISSTQLGNFPQAYSHVGMINAAFAVSPSWSEIL